MKLFDFLNLALKRKYAKKTVIMYFVILLFLLCLLFNAFSLIKSIEASTNQTIEYYLSNNKSNLSLNINSEKKLTYNELKKIQDNKNYTNIQKEVVINPIYKNIKLGLDDYYLKIETINSGDILAAEGKTWEESDSGKNNLWLNYEAYEILKTNDNSMSINSSCYITINDADYEFVLKGIINKENYIFIDQEYALKTGIADSFYIKCYVTTYNNANSLIKDTNAFIEEVNVNLKEDQVFITKGLVLNHVDEMIKHNNIIKVLLGFFIITLFVLIAYMIYGYNSIFLFQNLKTIIIYKFLGLKDAINACIFSVNYLIIMLCASIVAVLISIGTHVMLDTIIYALLKDYFIVRPVIRKVFAGWEMMLVSISLMVIFYLHVLFFVKSKDNKNILLRIKEE